MRIGLGSFGGTSPLQINGAGTGTRFGLSNDPFGGSLISGSNPTTLEKIERGLGTVTGIVTSGRNIINAIAGRDSQTTQAQTIQPTLNDGQVVDEETGVVDRAKDILGNLWNSVRTTFEAGARGAVTGASAASEGAARGATIGAGGVDTRTMLALGAVLIGILFIRSK